MDGKSRILIVSFLGRIGQVASKESTERQVVIHYLMGWNGVPLPAFTAPRTQLNYNFN